MSSSNVCCRAHNQRCDHQAQQGEVSADSSRRVFEADWYCNGLNGHACLVLCVHDACCRQRTGLLDRSIGDNPVKASIRRRDAGEEYRRPIIECSGSEISIISYNTAQLEERGGLL